MPRVSKAWGAKLPTKFRNKKIVVDGLSFDSQGEAARWSVLKLLERSREISHLERQVSYDLTVNGVKIGSFKPDFRYLRGGYLVVEDFKSDATITPLFKWKVNHFKVEYGIVVEISK